MVDQIIFIGFLLLCIIFGLFSGRKITTVKDYAVGDGDFSTATIAATIIATVISGSGFFHDLIRTYNEGLYFIWSIIFGTIILFWSIAYIFIPRMNEFLGKMSIASAMGDMFGKEVRVITATIGFLVSAGFIAMQLNVAGILFEQALGFPPVVGIIIIGLIVTGYSTFGGIRAVTFTDVIQMFTFGTVIPIIIFFIAISMDSYQPLINIFKYHPKFDFSKIFNFNLPEARKYLSLFFIMAIPGFVPTDFQRIAIAKDITQAKNSYIIAGIVCVLVMLLSCTVALLVLSNNVNLQGAGIFPYIIQHYGYPSLKGLILAGVMAMVMSTIDSHINASSVLFVNDICNPLSIKLSNNELFSTKFTSFLVGTLAIILVAYCNDLIKLFLLTNTFIMPVITPVFMLAVFGFRPHKYCVLTGMLAGAIGTAIWEFGIQNSSIASLFPGMLLNVIFLISSHYILRLFVDLPGGWVERMPVTEIIVTEPSKNYDYDNKGIIYRIKEAINDFHLKEFLEVHRLHDHLYFPLGLYCLSGTIFNMLNMDHSLFDQYFYLKYIYFTLVFFSTVIAMYPIWYFAAKSKPLIGALWHFSMFYMLIFVPTFLMLLTDFQASQVYFFILNICLITLVVSWQVTLVLLLPGALLALKTYGLMDANAEIHLLQNGMQQIGLIGMVLFTSVTIALFRPKDEGLDLSYSKVSHLTNRLNVQTEQLKQLSELKQQFINNITHEHHAPMTGIISTSQVLAESYDKIPEEERIKSIKLIYRSAVRLFTLENNLAILQQLANAEFKLNVTRFNFGRLAHKCLYIAHKLYIPKEEGGKRTFLLQIPDNIYIEADKSYLEHVIGNLLVNAINYCPFGKIKLKVTKEKDKVQFTITDEGIGIPKNEVEQIFEEFVVSSRTYSKAGGRGIGLSVCKKIVTAHHGTIWAENNFNHTAFHFVIPIKQSTTN